MRDAILNFPKQFAYEPVIENADKLGKFGKYVVCGMGGSSLGADLLRVLSPDIDVYVHRNYGLPNLHEYANTLIIANSYSGNTEETIDAFNEALKKKYPIAVVSTGGQLLNMAQERSLPYIQMPSTGIQPRMATGFNIRALLTLFGNARLLEETGTLPTTLNPNEYEADGRDLASRIKNAIPIIYASEINQPVAYNWKIKFNETGKIPAFYNVLPELNHNEMTGLDVKESTEKLSSNFYFIFLHDVDDHPRIQKRMEVLKALYLNRGLSVGSIEMKGVNTSHKVFSSLMVADWTALYTAEQYGLESEQVPMVEEFKRLIA